MNYKVRFLRLLALFFAIFLFSVFLLSCSDKTKNDLTNPVVYLNKFGPSWVIYGGYLSSDININYLVNNSNSSMNFSYNDNGKFVISINWDGKLGTAYGGGGQVNYYGFYLTFTQNKDLSSTGYNKITFDVKGHLNSNNILEVTGLNSVGTQVFSNTQISSNTYTTLSLSIPSGIDETKVSQIITFAIKSTDRSDLDTLPANILIDNITLKKI